MLYFRIQSQLPRSKMCLASATVASSMSWHTVLVHGTLQCSLQPVKSRGVEASFALGRLWSQERSQRAHQLQSSF